MQCRLFALQAGDVAEVAPIHRQAFQGYMNTRLGTAYTAAFLSWFVRHPAHSIGFVARDEATGVALGYVVGVSRDREPDLVRSLVPWAVAGMVVRPWLLFDANVLRKIQGRLKEMVGRDHHQTESLILPTPTMGLIAIGVAAQARGRAVGAELMRAFEEQARARGAASVFLSVYADNGAARRLYERSGWVIPPGNHFRDRAYYYAKDLGGVLAPLP